MTLELCSFRLAIQYEVSFRNARLKALAPPSTDAKLATEGIRIDSENGTTGPLTQGSGRKIGATVPLVEMSSSNHLKHALIDLG